MNYCWIDLIQSIGKVSKSPTNSKEWQRRQTKSKKSLPCQKIHSILKAKMRKFLTRPAIGFALLFFWWIIVQYTWFNRLANFQSYRPPQKRVATGQTKLKKSLPCQKLTQMEEIIKRFQIFKPVEKSFFNFFFYYLCIVKGFFSFLNWLLLITIFHSAM